MICWIFFNLIQHKLIDILFPVYSNIHRAIIQTLMNHGAYEEKDLIKVFNLICRQFELEELPRSPAESLQRVIDLINTKISRFDQKVVKFQYGLNLVDYYVFCSTAKTSVSSMQNFYNEDELDFFKRVLVKIIENEELCISPLAALNLQTSSSGKVNQSRAQKLIENWIRNGYFVKQENSMIYLGPKSLVEFKDLLQTMELPYLRTCVLCEDVAAWVIFISS